jgi:hypothetical protein
MPDLVSYLFGPGRHNEHVNQHLVAGYADAVFTADDKLWQTMPGTQRSLRDEARDLGWQVEYPHSRWGTEVPHGYVWHCSLSIPAAEGRLTDAQWAEAAHTVVDALGFSGADGKAPCRWVAIRHGLSGDGNDHVHLAVNLVREDGTKASTWNDYRKAGAACAGLEKQFGLNPVRGRITGRSVPEPTRKDREISAARGEPEPLRVHLERTIRACAAAARSEAHFVALARANGLLIRPRYDDRATMTGYAVADPRRRHAWSRQTGTRGPVWFGGGKLASDLTLPSLRRRWETNGPHAQTEALAAWSAATSLNNQPPATRSSVMTIGDDPAAAADLLAAAAVGCEQDKPGPLAQAARLMAKAAQHHSAPTRRPEIAAVISDMASTFLAVTATTLPGNPHAVLALMTEVGTLVDACVAKAQATRTATATREVRQASVLVHASLDALSRAVDRQVSTAMSAVEIYRMEETMTDLTHEEEFLGHLTAAGMLSTRLIGTATGQPVGEAPDVKALRAAGYRNETPFDEHLRRELGEPRWAKYATDPARVLCAALITDGAAAGRDMYALLSKAADMRAWEDDDRSPARSIARVLAYRIKRELDKPASRRTSAYSSSAHLKDPGLLTDGGLRASPAPAPMPSTPWDDHLRGLLGDRRWQQFAGDERRRDIAETLTRAHASGYDVAALLTEAVTSREWEDDPRSPARRVGGVLQYRIQAAIASCGSAQRRPEGTLPSEVATVVTSAIAPADDRATGAAHSPDSPAARPPSRNPRQVPGRDLD